MVAHSPPVISSGHFSAPAPHRRPPGPAVGAHGNGWKWGAAAFAAGIAGAAALGLWGSPALKSDDLAGRMQNAASGLPSFGDRGDVAVEGGGQRISVVAKGVSPRDCVSAGWVLVRKGALSINGITPQRVSSAALTELCNQDDTASLRWVPRGP